MGALARAPYWLFDGVTLVAILFMVCYALLNSKAREDDRSLSRRKQVVWVIWRVSALVILVELGVLVTAVVLLDQVMNPLYPQPADDLDSAQGGYGRKGSSFVFCSVASATIHFLVVRRFLLQSLQSHQGNDEGSQKDNAADPASDPS